MIFAWRSASVADNINPVGRVYRSWMGEKVPRLSA
jgi:hypothetical protein